ncbi:MAG: hypothetical protein M0Q21_03090 [Ignavibacteriaceae bacterium]|nr:hypothetical protein [Ignavibacteriaceae bacterium]
MNNKIIYKIVRNIFFFTIPAIILLIFISSVHLNGLSRAMYVDMVYGKAFKPFVTRTLTPSMIRIISSATPIKVKSALTEFVNHDNFISVFLSDNVLTKRIIEKKIKHFYPGQPAQFSYKQNLFVIILKYLKWEPEFILEYLFGLLLMYFALVGFAFSQKYLISLIFTSNKIFIDSIVIISLLLLPALNKYSLFVYDFPTLFLFTLCLVLMIKQRWKEYLIIFSLATLNKETTVLLIGVYYFYYLYQLKQQDRIFKRVLIAQVIIYVGLRLLLYVVYLNNPGSSIEFHLIDHNLILFTNLLHSADVALVIFSLVVFLFLLFYKWSEKPVFIKCSLQVPLFLFILTLFFGFIDEWRDYYESIPVIILFFLHSIGKIFNFQVSVK